MPGGTPAFAGTTGVTLSGVRIPLLVRLFRRREMGQDLARQHGIEPVGLGRCPTLPLVQPRLIDSG